MEQRRQIKHAFSTTQTLSSPRSTYSAEPVCTRVHGTRRTGNHSGQLYTPYASREERLPSPRILHQTGGRRGLYSFRREGEQSIPKSREEGNEGLCFAQLTDCLWPRSSVFPVQGSHRHVLTHPLLIAGREAYSPHLAPQKKSELRREMRERQQPTPRKQTQPGLQLPGHVLPCSSTPGTPVFS